MIDDLAFGPVVVLLMSMLDYLTTTPAVSLFLGSGVLLGLMCLALLFFLPATNKSAIVRTAIALFGGVGLTVLLVLLIDDADMLAMEHKYALLLVSGIAMAAMSLLMAAVYFWKQIKVPHAL